MVKPKNVSSARAGRRRIAVATISQMVVEALKSPRSATGSTVERICKFVCDMNAAASIEEIIDKVPTAIKRGVTFGVIKQCGNRYKLDPIMIIAAHEHPNAPKQMIRTKVPAKRRKANAVKGRRQLALVGAN